MKSGDQPEAMDTLPPVGAQRLADGRVSFLVWTPSTASRTGTRAPFCSCSLPLGRGRWWKLLDSSDSRWLGEGSRIPDTLESSGEARLEICGSAVRVVVREKAE